MDLVVIVGLMYKDESYLSSALTDIYHVYNYCSTDKFLIITDWNFKSSKKLGNPKHDKWNEFIARKTATWVHVNNYESLESSFMQYSNIICNSKRILFYYSGHGVTVNDVSYFEMPDGGLIEQNCLHKWFSRSDTQTLYILDCCCPSSIGLPYKLEGRKMERKDNNYVPGNIICITSSMSSQESLACNKYSLFTKYLFRILREESCCRLSELVSLLQGRLLIKTSQQVCVYSSNYCVPILWSWIYGDINIKITPLQNNLIISRECLG